MNIQATPLGDTIAGRVLQVLERQRGAPVPIEDLIAEAKLRYPSDRYYAAGTRATAGVAKLRQLGYNIRSHSGAGVKGKRIIAYQLLEEAVVTQQVRDGIGVEIQLEPGSILKVGEEVRKAAADGVLNQELQRTAGMIQAATESCFKGSDSNEDVNLNLIRLQGILAKFVRESGRLQRPLAE